MTDLRAAIAYYDRGVHEQDGPVHNTIKAVAFADPVEIAFEVEEAWIQEVETDKEADDLIDHVRVYQAILRNDPRAWDGQTPCHNGSDAGDRCGECDGCVTLGQELRDHCVLEASSEAEADVIAEANPGHPVSYPLPPLESL